LDGDSMSENLSPRKLHVFLSPRCQPSESNADKAKPGPNELFGA
jgi:hypothetical protein